jgi:hypothetical protein
MPDQPDIGEQAISKVAEAGLSSQLDEAEDLKVDVRTDPGKLMQGELESVEIDGKGLVMQKDLRTEELNVKTGNVGIDPLKAAFGEIKLNHPTDAQAHVVLTEADLERAFNSQYIKQKLQNLKINVNGEPTTINTEHVQFRLPGEEKVALTAEVVIAETNEKKQVSFTARPQKSSGGEQVVLEDVQYGDTQELSPELTDALLDSTKELLDLRNFELQGMSLRLKGLDLQQGKLRLEATAHVEEFPDS